MHASPPASWSRRLTRSSTIAVTNVSRRAGHLAAPTCCFRPELAFSTATLSNSSVAAIPRLRDHSPPTQPLFCDGLIAGDALHVFFNLFSIQVETRHRVWSRISSIHYFRLAATIRWLSKPAGNLRSVVRQAVAPVEVPALGNYLSRMGQVSFLPRPRRIQSRHQSGAEDIWPHCASTHRVPIARLACDQHRLSYGT